MINPFKDTNWNPDVTARRKFATSLIVGFPILAVLLMLRCLLASRHAPMSLVWFGASGATVGIVLWGIPAIAKPFYLAWYFTACCIGIVVSNLLIAAFFYLVLTPAGMILRSFGHDAMTRRYDPKIESYWRDAERVDDPALYFRQY